MRKTTRLSNCLCLAMCVSIANAATPSLPPKDDNAYHKSGKLFWWRKFRREAASPKDSSLPFNPYVDYLPLSGGTLTGNLTLDNVDGFTTGLVLQQGSAYRHLITGYADGLNPYTGSALQFRVANDYTGGNAAVMTLRGGGDVGIGTATPFTRLSVGTYVGIGSTNDAAGAMVGKDGLVFQASNTSYRGAAIVGQQSGTYGVHLLFGTKASGGNELKERMRITESGNVGVGTTAPATRMHISAASPALASKGTLFLGTTETSQVEDNGAQLTFGGYLAGDPSQNYNHAAIRGVAESSVTNSNSGALVLATAGSTTLLAEHMRITGAGYIGIGTRTPTEKLSVNGNILTKKIRVTQLGWSDYVFDENYPLRDLYSVEQYIKQNKHLPEVPSAKEVEEKGIDLGDTQALLLKKIEELTLHMIAMKKENENLRIRVEQLESKKVKK